MAARLVLAATALFPVAAAASGAGTGTPRPGQVSALDTGLVSTVPVFTPVVPPASYRGAVERGTRTAAGAPGPRYWQQQVDYRIHGRLLPDSGIVRGRETVAYINHSPDTLSSLTLHLYQNIFAPGVQRDRTVRLTGGIHLERVEAEGRVLTEGAGRGPDTGPGAVGRADADSGSTTSYAVDGTLAHLRLPRPLPPGDTARLGFAWHFRMPGEKSFRTGSIDHELFVVAQWYPQVAVYDDVDGWDETPYLGDGEFYLEYGDFDVDLTVPAGYLVSATGTLENPGAVLRPAALGRLRAAAGSDSVLAVVSAADREAGRATLPGDAAGTLTWHYRAHSVRDFAFAASSRYVWDAVGARVGGEQGRTRVDALYDPDVSWWANAARYEKNALEFYSRFIMPYPWPHATAAYGPIGGMEYPMLVFIGRSGPGPRLYGVLAHELSHQWFPMQVGSREAAYAWMDEGLTTFDESLAAAHFFGNDIARLGDRASYLLVARLGLEAPLMQNTDHVTSPRGRVVAAYSKPATVLHALRTLIGPAAFDSAYSLYARAWRYRHPLPWDFFSIMDSAAGRNLDWFWKEWFYRTVTLDQAVTRVRQDGDSVHITVENLGGAVMPVLLRLTLEDGSTESARWPVRVWAGTRRVTRAMSVSGPVVQVELDPDERFPDIDRTNDVWKAKR